MNETNSWSEQLLQAWPVLVPLLCTWWNLKTEIKANRKSSLEMFNFQERKNDARDTIPVVIEILEDLADLQQAFIFRGRFIPGVEHRCPNIQFKDGATENQISIAERTHQLRLITRRVLNNCRKVIFLMPENVMPETVEACKAIKNAWTGKAPGKKYAYEIKINAIGSILQNECDHLGVTEDVQQQFRQSRQNIIDNDEKSCDRTAAELEELHTNLETRVEKEFPTYARERSLIEKNIWGKILIYLHTAFHKIIRGVLLKSVTFCNRLKLFKKSCQSYFKC